MNLDSEIKELQRWLAQIDLPTESGEQPRGKSLRFLLLKLEDIKIKMYQEIKHALPHIHIDYGKQHHVAIFSIEPPARLGGTLNYKYDKKIIRWIVANKHKLLNIWKTVCTGDKATVLVGELAGTA